MAKIAASSRSLSFELPAGGNPGAEARARLDALRGDLHPAQMAKLRLLVSELVNRALAAPRGAMVEVSITVSGQTVRASVSGREEEARPHLDWALFLVRRISARWGVADGVWFELHRRPDG